MSRFQKTLSSTIGKKLIMSLTGLFLCLFLIIHLIGNLQLFKDDGGQAFNEYAYTMTHFAPIKIVSYLLYLSIIVHAIYALIVTIRNKKARPVGYAKYDGAANSKWNSRNMGLLGTIILIFIVVHMNGFWYTYHFRELPYVEYRTNVETGETTAREISAQEFREYVSFDENGENVVRAKNLYAVVDFAFQNWWMTAFYVLAMAALGFHLAHGFNSAFRTLGMNHNRYGPLVKSIGIWVFGVLIPLGFAMMPLYFFFK